LDPFAVLGVPARFEQDPVELERVYKSLTRKLHPDRFAKADPRARRYSLERSTQVNDAFKQLRTAASRAETLLRMGGVSVGEERGGHDASVDPAFLMEIMEQREALAEARAAGDRAALTHMEQDMRARRDAVMTRVAEGFARCALADVARELGTLRYYDRFLTEIESMEEAQVHG
jgi:molecular chaperone HscB